MWYLNLLTTLVFWTTLVRSLESFAAWSIFATDNGAGKTWWATDAVLAWRRGRNRLPVAIGHRVDGTN